MSALPSDATASYEPYQETTRPASATADRRHKHVCAAAHLLVLVAITSAGTTAVLLAGLAVLLHAFG